MSRFFEDAKHFSPPLRSKSGSGRTVPVYERDGTRPVTTPMRDLLMTYFLQCFGSHNILDPSHDPLSRVLGSSLTDPTNRTGRTGRRFREAGIGSLSVLAHLSKEESKEWKMHGNVKMLAEPECHRSVRLIRHCLRQKKKEAQGRALFKQHVYS